MTNPLLDPEFIYDFIKDSNAQRMRELQSEAEVKRISEERSHISLN